MDEITFGMLLPTLKLSKLQLKNIFDQQDLLGPTDPYVIVHPEMLSELIFADFLLQLYFIDADQRQLITGIAGDLVTQLRGELTGPPKLLIFVDGRYFGTSAPQTDAKLFDLKTGEPFYDLAYIPKESLVYNLEEVFRRKIQEIRTKAATNGERQEDDPTLA